MSGTATALEMATVLEMGTALEMATGQGMATALGTTLEVGIAQRTAALLITATLIMAMAVHRVTRTRRTERGWGNRETRISRRTPVIEITPTAAIQLAISGVLTRQSAGSGLVPLGVRGRKSGYLDPFRLQAVLLTGWAGSRRRALSQGVPRHETTRQAWAKLEGNRQEGASRPAQ